MGVDINTVTQILTLANTLEPVVLKYILALMQNAQGKTVEDLTADADSIWAQVKANADKELGNPQVGSDPLIGGSVNE